MLGILSALHTELALTAGWNREKSFIDYLLQEKSNFHRFLTELGADSYRVYTISQPLGKDSVKSRIFTTFLFSYKLCK